MLFNHSVVWDKWIDLKFDMFFFLLLASPQSAIRIFNYIEFNTKEAHTNTSYDHKKTMKEPVRSNHGEVESVSNKHIIVSGLFFFSVDCYYVFSISLCVRFNAKIHIIWDIYIITIGTRTHVQASNAHT